MKNTNMPSKTITVVAALVLSGASAHAATLVDTNTGPGGDTSTDGAGELFVGIHATGGQGNGVSVVVDLGAISPYAAVSAGGKLTFVVGATGTSNIGADLVAQFGANWYERTDVLWAAASATRGTVPSTSTDPTQTLYGSVKVSSYNPSVAPSTTGYTRATQSTQGTPATNIASNMALGVGGFADAGTPAGVTGTNVAIEIAGSTQGWAAWMPGGAQVPPSTGTPFNSFNVPTAANFEQPFSIGTIGNGVEGALDVFRMQRTGTPDIDNNNATSGAGTYQFTLTIDSTGNIAGAVLPVPEPASIALLASGSMFLLGFRRRGTGARVDAAFRA